MCFVSICYGYVLYFSSLSLLQARSSPHDERQRERKGGQNRAPGDVDQQRFAFGDLRDDVLRRVGRFRGDDGGCNQRRGRDDGLLFVLVPKKKRGFRESSSSIRFLLRISTRVFPPLLYDQAGSLRRRDRKKINPADAQNLSSVFRTNLPGKRKNHSGRDGRARKSSATSRARECTRRDFLRLFFSRATGGPPPPPPPHFCALPVWTTTTEKSIVFLPHTKGHIRALKRKEEKKNKRKRPPKQTRASSSSKSERTYLLDGWVFQRFRRFRARAFRLRGIRSRRLGDDFRGGGCNGVHDFFFLSRFFFVMMMNE